MVTWTTFYGSRSKSQWFWDTKLSSGSYPQHCIKINTTGKSTKQQFFIDYRTIEHLRKSIIFRDHGWTKTTFYMYVTVSYRSFIIYLFFTYNFNFSTDPWVMIRPNINSATLWHNQIRSCFIGRPAKFCKRTIFQFQSWNWSKHDKI